MDTLTGPAELLRSVPVLAELSEELLAQMSASVKLVSLSAGEWLFRAGDEARTAYVLASGRLEVIADGPSPAVLEVLRRGAVIGELALLRRERRAASIRARRDSSLIALDREQFEALLRDAPAFALALTRGMADQLARSAGPARPVRPPRTIAVVALEDASPAAVVAAEALADELERHGPTDRIFAEPTEHPHARLARAETHDQHAVLLAPRSDPSDPWTGFCLREADLTVAITNGRPKRAWYAHAAAVSGCEMVTLDGPPADDVIDHFRPQTVRSVRGAAGLPPLMEQLGRRAAGRSVGVVLSGGGARALSHLGVVEELLRAGIRIDRIGGVSLGAIIAAFHARGDTPEQAYETCRRSFVEQNPTSDFTLPLVSLIRGRKTARLLFDCFGDVRIEELALPFFCTSTDLLRRRLVVHRTGPLVEALLASLSIPGVFPPARDRHGRLLVDGGVLDNLPAPEMNRAAEGPLVAVDVTGTATGEAAHAHPKRGLSGVLERAITGTAGRLPRLSETIVRCMTLASADTVAAARTHADLVITPEVAGIGLLDWRRLPDMHRAGIQAARRALSAHPDLTGVLRQ